MIKKTSVLFARRSHKNGGPHPLRYIFIRLVSGCSNSNVIRSSVLLQAASLKLDNDSVVQAFLLKWCNFSE